MATIFEKLQYNFYPAEGSNTIIEFSPEVIQTLNSTPAFIPRWGYDDMIADDDNGYIINPVADVTNGIISVCNSLKAEANVANTDLRGIENVCVTCVSSGTAFFDHTQRISGVVQINSTTALLPHYDTAMAIGKSLTYIVFQADGYANSSVVLGSFTSLLIEEELNDKLITISTYPATVNNSIYLDGDTYRSNLSNDTINTMTTTISSITTIFNDRKWHDENFYTNSKNILDRFEGVKRYTSMGSTDDHLVRNYLATSKLQERI
jgi:hypothetical protein